jgi:hypothetical protein
MSDVYLSEVNLYPNYTLTSRTSGDGNDFASTEAVIGGESLESGSFAARWRVEQNDNNRVEVVGCTALSRAYLDKHDGGVIVDAGDGGDGGPDAADGGGVCDNAPGPFGLQLPTQGQQNVSLYTRFVWSASPDPDTGDQVAYRLVVSLSQDLSDPLVDIDVAGTEFTLTQPLPAGTRLYYQVSAYDSCSDQSPERIYQSEIRDFTTVAECMNPPGSFDLVSPADGQQNVSITPTLDVSDATDLDLPNDSLIYRCEVATDSSFANIVRTLYSQPNQSFCTIDATEALANGTPYVWRAAVTDGCNNEETSNQAYRTFTTDLGCVPFNIFDTDFTTGNATDLEVSNGSITLFPDESVWERYDAVGTPSPAQGWATVGSFVPPTPDTTGNILWISTLASNVQGYYEKDPGCNNATGCMVEARIAVDGLDEVSSPWTSGFTLAIADGVRQLRFNFFANAICEPYNSLSNCETVTTSNYNVYRLEYQGDSYTFSINGAVASAFTGSSLSDPGGATYLRFGDDEGNADGSAHIDYLYYYNGGNQLPYVSPGLYVSDAGSIDTGINNYNYSGSNISWLPLTNPGEVEILVRAANSISGLSSATWSNPLTNNPASLPSISGL